MRYAAIKPSDVANGPGVRVSLFVSGCTHCCEGCFNSVAWDFLYGEDFTQETIEAILSDLDHSYISGLTLLGGEPMHPHNQKALVPLVEAVKRRYPQKTIWCYTGYDFETDIIGDMMLRIPETKRLLSCFDVIVDGRFELENKDLKLRFKGSSNQRIIQVQESLLSGNIVLWE